MAIYYDQPIGKVRLLIADLDESAPILTDEHITGYLDLNDSSVHRAAADALDAIATTESLLSKAIRTQDLATDGPKVATDLRKRAAQLRAKADADDAAAKDEPFFEIVPFASSFRPEGAEYRW
ncbi:hypothetical protein ASF21_12870 [Arthrobacter sp. Leaf234]|uniref:hypothetical protein n=1 Tax=Arthrobacter sp. Leaf234 TaxID=1736303 RepID=UPI0006F92124|nr:hypothetical protein [Arthrobacter sp. Leaf234]KQN99694.1 hypothetical protein ASF21_12870 [Arthrobacter sp. Leaf234]